MPEKDDLTQLESEIENVLSELSSLEVEFTQILQQPQIGSSTTVDTNYLVAVRRFQNGMRVSIRNGAETGNKQTFLEGFKFYEAALTLLKASGDMAEIQNLIHELVQLLYKVLEKANPVSEDGPYGTFFLRKSCQYIANIYESSKDFQTALQYHDRAANLSRGLDRELEFLQKIIDALLSNDPSTAQATVNLLKIKHVQRMASLLISGFKEKKEQYVQSARGLLETLAAQRGLSVSQILSLIEALSQHLHPKPTAKPAAASPVTKVAAPSKPIHLSQDVIGELRNVLKEGIQQLKGSQPGGVANAPIIDTGAIVSEIKNYISGEIKAISSEIANQIMNKMPVGLPSASRPHSGGTISDDAPLVQAVGPAGPEDRQKRPKLDDMLDSIIVSE